MTTQANKTAQVGDLIAAAFDHAAQYSSDPDEVSLLATTAVMRILLRHRRPVRESSGTQRRLPAR
jgi:hypothetical protein